MENSPTDLNTKKIRRLRTTTLVETMSNLSDKQVKNGKLKDIDHYHSKFIWNRCNSLGKTWKNIS